MKNPYTVKCDDTTKTVEIWRTEILICTMNYEEFRFFYKALTPAYILAKLYLSPEDMNKFEEAEGWE